MNKKILEFCLSPDLGGLELFMVQQGKKLDNYIEEKKHYLQRNRLFPFLPAMKLARFKDDVYHKWLY